MDVRKWCLEKIDEGLAQARKDAPKKGSYILQEHGHVADAFTPAITKLVDLLEEIEDKGQCDFSKVHAVLEGFRNVE